jgi:nitrite reductase/ring-hydroxylating ferredoxin subunit
MKNILSSPGRENLIFTLCCLVLIGVMSSFSGCKGKDNYPQIPYVPVNIFLDPNSTMYLELNAVGGWVYVTADAPSRGIIIYRLSQDEFMAYERICPYDPDMTNARVEVESSGVTATDSLCGSRFILTDGQPFKGPATLPLKQYRTAYDGNTLHIFN